MDRDQGVVSIESARADRSAKNRISHVYADVGELIAARAPSHPVLCFSRGRARDIAHRFQVGFPGTVTYAVKSNPSRDLIAAFSAAGISAFDVASTTEMEFVRSVSPRAVLHYNNPIRSS